MYVVKNRSIYDIVEIILKTSQAPVIKSTIQRSTGLNWKYLTEHIENLVEEGLLDEMMYENKLNYITSQKGQDFLKLKKEMKNYIDVEIQNSKRFMVKWEVRKFAIISY